MEEPKKPTARRLTIRGLLAATAILAVAAAPIDWLGPTYVLSATLSLLLLAAVGAVIAKRWWAVALAPCLLVGLCCIPMVMANINMASALFLQSIGTAIVCLATATVTNYPRSRFLACVVVMVLAYVPTFQAAIASDQEVDRMLQHYPLVSIRDRLPDMAERELRPVSLNKDQDAAIAAIDNQFEEYNSYRWQLEQLHQESYKEFARAPGFGFLRMGPMTEQSLGYRIVRLVGEPVTLPMRLPSQSNPSTPADLHKTTLVNFLDRQRLGYVAEAPDRVAGFLGHGVGPRSYNNHWSYEPDPTGHWTLNRLELIGLMTHDEPVAYVSDQLPNMEDLGGAPIRGLNKFEREALARLGGQEDVVIDEQTDEGATRITMLGALRAGKSCAACHDVPYGTLLGAFSYELTLDTAQGDENPTTALEP